MLIAAPGRNSTKPCSRRACLNAACILTYSPEYLICWETFAGKKCMQFIIFQSIQAGTICRKSENAIEKTIISEIQLYSSL
jgi:hypothetical protein